jgi:hypothetical protein
MIFDLSGVHRVVVRYCECCESLSGTEIYVQLLRSDWFPATLNRPSTVFTYQLLDFFQQLQDQNKCNPYDFYHTIVRLADSAGLNSEIVSDRFASRPSF